MYDSTEMQSISGEIENVKVTMTLVGEGVKVRRKDLGLGLGLGDRRPLTWRSAKVAPFHHVDIHVCICGRCLGAYSCDNEANNTNTNTDTYRPKVTDRLKMRLGQGHSILLSRF